MMVFLSLSGQFFSRDDIILLIKSIVTDVTWHVLYLLCVSYVLLICISVCITDANKHNIIIIIIIIKSK